MDPLALFGALAGAVVLVLLFISFELYCLAWLLRRLIRAAEASANSLGLLKVHVLDIWNRGQS